MPAETITSMLTPLVPEPIAFDRQAALVAASIRERTREQGISFGDCACLALATILGLSAVTAKRKWDKCDLDVEVLRIP